MDSQTPHAPASLFRPHFIAAVIAWALFAGVCVIVANGIA